MTKQTNIVPWSYKTFSYFYWTLVNKVINYYTNNYLTDEEQIKFRKWVLILINNTKTSKANNVDTNNIIYAKTFNIILLLNSSEIFYWYNYITSKAKKRKNSLINNLNKFLNEDLKVIFNEEDNIIVLFICLEFLNFTIENNKKIMTIVNLRYVMLDRLSKVLNKKLTTDWKYARVILQVIEKISLLSKNNVYSEFYIKTPVKKKTKKKSTINKTLILIYINLSENIIESYIKTKKNKNVYAILKYDLSQMPSVYTYNFKLDFLNNNIVYYHYNKKVEFLKNNPQIKRYESDLELQNKSLKQNLCFLRTFLNTKYTINWYLVYLYWIFESYFYVDNINWYFYTKTLKIEIKKYLMSKFDLNKVFVDFLKNKQQEKDLIIQTNKFQEYLSNNFWEILLEYLDSTQKNEDYWPIIIDNLLNSFHFYLTKNTEDNQNLEFSNKWIIDLRNILRDFIETHKKDINTYLKFLNKVYSYTKFNETLDFLSNFKTIYFYLGLQIDSRGRMYYTSYPLNPQGEKYLRYTCVLENVKHDVILEKLNSFIKNNKKLSKENFILTYLSKSAKKQIYSFIEELIKLNFIKNKYLTLTNVRNFLYSFDVLSEWDSNYYFSNILVWYLYKIGKLIDKNIMRVDETIICCTNNIKKIVKLYSHDLTNFYNIIKLLKNLNTNSKEKFINFIKTKPNKNTHLDFFIYQQLILEIFNYFGDDVFEFLNYSINLLIFFQEYCPWEHSIIFKDATSSVYQHLFMLLKENDIDILKSVNLLKNDYQMDFYKEVVDKTKSSLLGSNQILVEDPNINNCINFLINNLSRSIVKKSIMIMPYNAKAMTRYTSLKEQINSLNCNFDDKTLYKAIIFLDNYFYKSVLKSILQKTSDFRSALINNKNFQWTLPNGVVLNSHYLKKIKKRENLIAASNLESGESIKNKKITWVVYVENSLSLKNINDAIIANIIHSCDAYLLYTFLYKYHSSFHLNCLTIHDSIGSFIGLSDVVGFLYNESFVQTHKALNMEFYLQKEEQYNETLINEFEDHFLKAFFSII